MVRIPLPRPLEGIVPPMVTPLDQRRELDTRGTDRLAVHLVKGGVAGIFLLGTCGEGPAVSHRVRCELIERVCVAVDGRVPVLVGVSSPSLADSLELAEMADDAGASAIVATAPYYFPVGESSVVAHLRRLAHRSPLPLIVYNMPSCVGHHLSADAIHLLTEEPNIAGFKDSCGDLEMFRAFVAASANRPEWSRLVGPERLLVDAIAAGGTGGVNGGANVLPRLFVELYQAAKRNDRAAVELLQARTAQLGQIYGREVSVSSVVYGLKAALAELGICGRTMTEILTSRQRLPAADIREAMSQLVDMPVPQHAKVG